MRKAVRAFVLAAGLGKRLGPLRALGPKPLLPLGGIPLIRFALAKLRRAGVEAAVVNLHHRAEEVRAALGERAEGVALHYSVEPELLGTAGGLKKAEGFLREGGGAFFVVNADAPCGADLAAALAHHRRGGFLATLVLRESPEARRFGRLGADSAGRLCRFLGARSPAPPAGEVREAMFTGLSVLEPEILDHIPAGRPCGISEEVYPPLLEGGAPLGAVLSDAYWADAGTPARYLEANFDLLAGRFIPDLPWPGSGTFLAAGGALRWGEGTLRPPVLLARDVRLGPGAVAGPFAVLERGVTLSACAHVRESVLFAGASLSEGAAIERCLLGPGAVSPPGLARRGLVFLRGAARPLPLSEAPGRI